uniref:Zinc finger, CCHC-type n=1 Tax=Tanacetum cinerariifolium TaxID=118510 RepID=A0A6L2NNT5_TANCI|nr:zinc finger, CCHC-type [Tanacetum cinerariifolium]
MVIMARNAVKEMTTDFGKLDKFQGHDLRRWKKKMHFLLTTMKVVYVLTTLMPELTEDDTVENVESAKELWDSLESKYMKKDASKESLRAQESDKGKGKKVVGTSMNMTKEGSKNKNNKQNKEKKYGFNENNDGSGSNKKPKLECWKCGKTGHFKWDCRTGNKKNANVGGSGKGSKDQSQDQGQNLVPVWNRIVTYFVSLISEAFYVQVDAIAWWIDFGATTHVCKDRCWFKTYEPVEDGSLLYMGDDHFALFYGKGSVVLGFSSRKSITLFNVLYVPKLCKNLISSPVLNKCGYKQVYESDKYILSKSGVFVGFGYYNNGHVHYKRMLEMSKDDLIPAIDENPEKCTTCMLTKITRQPFKRIIHETTSPYTSQQNGVAERKNRALKEMVNSMLSYSGLSEGFREEAMLTACYLLNRVPNKGTRLSHMNFESRDAVFDENSFSSIPRPKDVIPNSDESQRDDHSNDVPSETPETCRDCSPMSTPMDPVEKLKPNTSKLVDQLEYSRAISCLIYAMTSTRPDIAYAIGRLSMFTSNPSRQHWHTITRVFKYLKGTMNYGLSYVGYPSVGGAISWASKNQTCITGSTMESKFVALAAAGKEAEWLRNLIHEILIWPKPIAPISINCDSVATLAKAYSQIYNGKSRHLGVRHSMIRELIMNVVISIEFVRSQHNLADHLTKGLARDLVIKCKTKMTTYVNMKFSRFKKLGLGFIYVH